MFNRIKNGRDIETNLDISTDETILLKYKDKFVAIGTKLADNRIHPKKVLV